ncbi:fasciclin-like arabinogalactan protein 12 isoform X2 [Salvia splendens]|uniref:fasciclin-like arabinogalactan protein 12 isoform X2 n=1 Tax=Salvia splendens TaxID=180675 RepID=UPI001C25C1F9|nr:fasciclin-like arabinogalactan protein 12 isoform X2 [Salvia splendens]
MKTLIVQVPVLLFLINCVPTTSQSPAAAPAPPGPPNVTAILEKDGHFTVFIKLLQSTKVADNLNSQLNTSNQGLTILAPPDTAFSGLKVGMLNSFTEDQQVDLAQFHVLPYYLPQSRFQTASNPLNTEAGGSSQLLAMNVTTIGNQVNITTGETNATVSSTIYDDNELAVYQVDKVLLPLRFYVPLPPPPPSPPPPKKAAPKASPAYSGPVDSHASRRCIRWIRCCFR